MNGQQDNDDGQMTKDEFREVYRQFKPEATDEDYDREWAKFQECKALHQRRN